MYLAFEEIGKNRKIKNSVHNICTKFNLSILNLKKALKLTTYIAGFKKV